MKGIQKSGKKCIPTNPIKNHFWGARMRKESLGKRAINKSEKLISV